ncbi:uncharacterized protein A1O9_03239 [Exophiala aquamarina CBS 119918]|uniref:Inositol-1-monophosphatase n=1 Tax=Exophiala aquamarina CBS 119918 TaxID=1182545 RepID=A0A072PP53_9EURO|nr:uncharacterized protein A1O9_03239 [Exophiala aquamarina CBS 119918]KEF61671.1 hypothetical protein A1O9_03239 [Exophiala aquamarina CBS 119918]
MSHDLLDICACLTEFAEEAGEIILKAQRSRPVITQKKNSKSCVASASSLSSANRLPALAADIVTPTDQEVEEFVRQSLAKRYPDLEFIGEETYKTGMQISDRPTFIVDPIDGTSNFVHSFPDVCISIGLLIVRRPAVGVVYNPFRQELWYAARGHGAFTQIFHGERQKLPFVSAPLQGLDAASVGIEWGSDKEGPNFKLNLVVFTTLARTAATGSRFINSLRCTGSAAITICRVATGQQDAFWECGCWAWDVAGAWCILVESGGIMIDGHPGQWTAPIDNRRYLAGRPATTGQRKFIQDFWSVIGENRSTYGPPDVRVSDSN